MALVPPKQTLSMQTQLLVVLRIPVEPTPTRNNNNASSALKHKYAMAISCRWLSRSVLCHELQIPGCNKYGVKDCDYAGRMPVTATSSQSDASMIIFAAARCLLCTCCAHLEHWSLGRRHAFCMFTGSLSTMQTHGSHDTDRELTSILIVWILARADL